MKWNLLGALLVSVCLACQSASAGMLDRARALGAQDVSGGGPMEVYELAPARPLLSEAVG